MNGFINLLERNTKLDRKMKWRWDYGSNSNKKYIRFSLFARSAFPNRNNWSHWREWWKRKTDMRYQFSDSFHLKNMEIHIEEDSDEFELMSTVGTSSRKRLSDMWRKNNRLWVCVACTNSLKTGTFKTKRTQSGHNNLWYCRTIPDDLCALS